MLGFASENIPQSGALGLAIMGGIGFLGGAIAQPTLGAIFDVQTKIAMTSESSLEQAQLAAGAHTLLYMALVPAVLILAFTWLYIYKRKNLTK